MISIKPAPYNSALRNPLKGITTRGIYDHPWASLAHSYIAWNEIESNTEDGTDKIKEVIDEKWQGIEKKNIKVIPRIYLYWDDLKKCWPSDMKEDDYTSDQFKNRTDMLVSRLGELWDNDERVAFIEMGIFGRWGEHHSPSPSAELQEHAGSAFEKHFRNKLVSVRHNWKEFTNFRFGEYWDSFAHHEQLWTHGKSIQELNTRTGLYKTNYIGGEVAYNWGATNTHPGDNPTDTLADEQQLDFLLNCIRWTHCTQLHWIDDYDHNNAEARSGAVEVQKTLGYRFILEEVSFTPEIKNGNLAVKLKVKNIGSAPFYYNWPVQVSLHDLETKQTVWKDMIKNTDIRTWLPGEEWTEPQWLTKGDPPEHIPAETWTTGKTGWRIPPGEYTVSGSFNVSLGKSKYILAISILDPGGMLPALRFATADYLEGGYHPVGLVSADEKGGGRLPEDLQMTDPAADKTLHYEL